MRILSILDDIRNNSKLNNSKLVQRKKYRKVSSTSKKLKQDNKKKMNRKKKNKSKKINKSKNRNIQNRKTHKKRRYRRRKKGGGLTIENVVKICNQFNSNLKHNDDFSDDESDNEDNIWRKVPDISEKSVGEGFFSSVYLCRDNYVIKFTEFDMWKDTMQGLRKKHNMEDFLEQMSNEVKIQFELAEEGISLKIYKSGSFENEEGKIGYYSIMDKADGDLEKFLNLIKDSKQDIDLNKIIDTIKNLFDKLHKLNYIHGDIQLANIVYSLKNKNDLNSVSFKIIDFGNTTYVKHDIDGAERKKDEMQRVDKFIIGKIDSIYTFGT